jgi:hypothetical protein
MVETKRFKYSGHRAINKLNLIIVITSLISIFISLIFNTLEEYQFIFLLPLAYMIFSMIFFNIHLIKLNYKPNIIFILANIVMMIKYTLTPLSIVFQQYTGFWGSSRGKWGPDPSALSMNLAIILMVLEILFIYITYFCVISFLSKRNKLRKYSNIESSNFSIFENRIVIVPFIFIVFVWLLIFAPEIFRIKSFFIIGDDFSKTILIHSSAGLVKILTRILRFSVFLIIEDIIYKNYKKTKSIANVFISFIALILYMGIISSTSRWELLFAAISGCYLLYVLYGNKIKIFTVPVIAIFLVAFMSITIYKFSYAISGGDSFQTVLGVLCSQFQDYFSGPRLVAQAIEMKELLGTHIGLSTIINDLFGNFPGLADFFNQQDRINAYFCYYNFGYWNNNTLLIPMLGEGFCYISIFPFFLSMFYEALVVIFDNMVTNSKRLEFKYLYVLEGCWLSFSICLNTQTSWGHFIELFLLTYIVFYLNNKISIKKRI